MNPPSIASFTASPDHVFVGDRTQLIAVFSGVSAEIEGLGPVQSGQPVDTPTLPAARSFTLTVRRDGRSVQATLRVEAGYRGRIRVLTDASVARTGHLAMALPDGSALVMGGNASDALNVPDSETSARFDPTSERFVAGPRLALSARDTAFTVAFPLPNGFLLAGGGINSGFGVGIPGPLLSQTFDPAGKQFTRAGDLRLNRVGSGKGTPLADGRVLMTGGGFPATRNTEIYDPQTRAWTEASPMGEGRRSHTATLLKDGRVLIAGGLQCCVIEPQIVRETFTSSAELYDPRTGEFTPTGSMGVARAFHQATLLPDGRVLVSGGLGDASPPGTEDLLARTEVYDPATGEFTQAGSLQVSRWLHAAVLLTDGRVLAVGGLRPGSSHGGIAVTELFDPQANRWDAGPTLDPAWFGVTATLLGNGKVLLFGGEAPDEFPRANAFLFE